MRGANKNLLYEKVKRKESLNLSSQEIKDFMQIFLSDFKKGSNSLTSPGTIFSSPGYAFVIKETHEWVEWIPLSDIKANKLKAGQEYNEGFYLCEKKDDPGYGYYIGTSCYEGQHPPQTKQKAEKGKWYSLVAEDYMPKGRDRIRSRVYVYDTYPLDTIIISVYRSSKKKFSKLQGKGSMSKIEDMWIL